MQWYNWLWALQGHFCPHAPLCDQLSWLVPTKDQTITIALVPGPLQGGVGVWQHAGPEDGKGEYASRTKVPFQMCQWDWPRNDFAKGQSLHASPSSHDLLQVPHRCRQKWLSRRKDTSWEGREGRWDRDGCIFQPRATSKKALGSKLEQWKQGKVWHQQS